MPPTQTLGVSQARRFLDGLFDGDLHAKRVLSLANATLGVIRATSPAVAAIGQGLAPARGLTTKHALKQVDRLLSNPGGNRTNELAALIFRLPGAAAIDSTRWGDSRPGRPIWNRSQRVGTAWKTQRPAARPCTTCR